MQSVESWVSEKRSAYLYRAMARAEAGTAREGMFNALAVAAEKQAEVWAEEAKRQGVTVPSAWTPDARGRLVAALIRAVGPRRMQGVLAAIKVRGLSAYTKASPEAGHPTPHLGMHERRHGRAGSGGGNLRAAVFGVNDGLVSNTSLILGIAGAAASGQMILLSGVAGLLAGAFSMAAGEYISVRSQREMLEHQIGLEREELAKYPEEEAAELALIYAARGIPKEDAERLAKHIVADPERALDTLTREELGLNPDELGSPVGAALSSFLSFAAGALVPLLPFLFMAGSGALVATALLSAASLFGVGAAISLFTGRRALFSGLRMLLIGGLAGAATFGIGKVVGVNLG
jgi:VIT1/CCC1 family predicted Fe2+/Mn2+ transporter